MPTLDDFIKKLDTLEALVLKEGPAISDTIAQTALTLARDRVEKEGIPGAQYSTKPMLATQDMFNRKAAFEPTEVATTLGRNKAGKLVKGGRRKRDGTINQKYAKPRWLWIKFPKAKKAVPVMVLPGGYKQLRQLNGLNTAFVDLTFTGRMLQNIKLLDRVEAEGKYLSVVGASDQENKKKLLYTSLKYGPYLDPIDPEREVIREVPIDKIRNILKLVFG